MSLKVAIFFYIAKAELIHKVKSTGKDGLWERYGKTSTTLMVIMMKMK